MEPVFFVMAILGCGDGADACREVRIEPARYATEAQCRADLVGGLARNSDLDFPELAGACRPNTVRLARAENTRPRG